MRFNQLALSFAAVLLICTSAFAQEEAIMERIETLHGQSADFVEVYSSLESVFLFGEPSGIADFAAYPLEIAANGELYDVLEAQDLLDNFDSLVTEDTLAALGSQDFDDLIVTSDGVGFANGAMWMALVCSDSTCADANWLITRITN